MSTWRCSSCWGVSPTWCGRWGRTGRSRTHSAAPAPHSPGPGDPLPRPGHIITLYFSDHSCADLGWAAPGDDDPAVVTGRHAAAVTEPHPPEAGPAAVTPEVRLGAVHVNLSEIRISDYNVRRSWSPAGHAPQGEQSPIRCGQLRPEHPVRLLREDAPLPGAPVVALKHLFWKLFLKYSIKWNLLNLIKMRLSTIWSFKNII